jgi:hypothetical protein
MDHLFTSSFEQIRPVGSESGGVYSETLTLVRTIKGYMYPLSGDKKFEHSTTVYTATHILDTSFITDIDVKDMIRDSDMKVYKIRAINQRKNPDVSLTYLEIDLEITITPSNLQSGSPLPPYISVIDGTIGHTFAISGDINVASGDTDFINSFFVNLITGQTARIIGYKCKVNSGSCVIDVKQNGTVVINDVSVSTTPASNLLQDIDLATGDDITIEVVSTSSAKNLSFTIFVEYICS